jgi:hypothetical protein
MRAAVIVIAGVPMTLWLGITGMALATLIAFALNLLAVVIVARPFVHGDGRLLWPAKVLTGVALAYLAGFVTARLIDSALDGLAGLVLALIAGSAAFAIALAVGGGITAGDRRRMGGLRDRLRPALSRV